MSPFRIFTVAALAVSVSLPIAALADQTPAAPPAAAAPPAGHAHHGGRYMHALRSLSLSPAQKQQIKDLAMQTRSANQGVDKPTRRANMQKLRSQIDGILTPDQRAQLRAEMQKERAAQGT